MQKVEDTHDSPVSALVEAPAGDSGSERGDQVVPSHSSAKLVGAADPDVASKSPIATHDVDDMHETPSISAVLPAGDAIGTSDHTSNACDRSSGTAAFLETVVAA
jgi:hypothetical protein